MKYLFILSLIVVGSGCVANQTSSLYDDLGGKERIDRITGRFIFEIGQDNATLPFFENTNLDRFFEKFSEHLCAVSGGPCEYTGDDMHDVHVGMHIDEATFNRTVDLLIRAMTAENVPHPVQNRLLKQLAPLRSEITYR